MSKIFLQIRKYAKVCLIKGGLHGFQNSGFLKENNNTIKPNENVINLFEKCKKTNV